MIHGLQEAGGGLRADEVRHTLEGAAKNRHTAGGCPGRFFLKNSRRAQHFNGGQAGDTDLEETPLFLQPEVMAEGFFLSEEIEQALVSLGANATSGSMSTQPEMEPNSQLCMLVYTEFMVSFANSPQ